MIQELSQDRRDEGHFFGLYCFVLWPPSAYLIEHFSSHIFSKDFLIELVFMFHMVYEVSDYKYMIIILGQNNNATFYSGLLI